MPRNRHAASAQIRIQGQSAGLCQFLRHRVEPQSDKVTGAENGFGSDKSLLVHAITSNGNPGIVAALRLEPAFRPCFRDRYYSGREAVVSNQTPQTQKEPEASKLDSVGDEGVRLVGDLAK